MDLYTTSFLLSSPPLPPPASQPTPELQRLCQDIGAREACLVTVSADPNGKGWNFLISGSYGQVMSARGQVLREGPRRVIFRIKVSRSEILDSPLSPSCALKPDVRRKLDEIASQTRALLSVVNPEGLSVPQSGTESSSNGKDSSDSGGGGGIGSGAFGLETERMCEIVVEGDAPSVELAKVRVLVMLDQLSGLHADVCEIDHKLHPIIAGRKRCVIQTIQEETGTNIFFPTPLCGFIPPFPHPHAAHHQQQQMGFPHHQPQNPYQQHHAPYPQQQQHHQHQQHGYHPQQQQQQHSHHGQQQHNNNGGYPQQQQHQHQHGPYGGAGGQGGYNNGGGMQSGGQGGGDQGGPAAARNPLNAIWITGEFFGVQRAKDMLFQVSMHKVRSKCIISRDTSILPRKLDWLVTERLEEIKTIMADNSTFISFPVVGSQASLISIYGDQRVNIERTIRSIMALVCQFYVASFWLLPISFDVLMPSATINPSQMQPTLQRIANLTGAEIVFKSNCFEMHGLEGQVRSAVGMVLELDVIKNFHHEIRFQIELANQHRDFISGKKNGKINKIMKMANVKIKFDSFSADFNFVLDVAGNDQGALHGLSMLQEELPAEVSFHVPESYHKRIIGVGGKNIQRIMKKYGVYVKFSNAEEFAQLGGYSDNEDNVVARTPAKNAMNLEQLKQSVMELVNPKDKDYTVETVSIPRRYHRTLLGEKSIFIHDIESKTNSVVRFPNKESASDIVTIFGPESQVHIAAAMLLDHVPFEADLHVPFAPDLGRVTGSPEFLQLVEKLKRDLQIAIISPTRFNQGEDSLFKFRCQRSNIDFLGSARDALEEYLVSRKVVVYPSNRGGRNDSFADAFPHFNSALLPSKYNLDSEAPPPNGESLIQRRLRPIPSANDVKALFDSPHGYYADAPSTSHSSIPTASSTTTTSASYDNGSSPSLTQATPSNGTSGNGGTSNYERNGYGGGRHQISDFWAPPLPQPTSSPTPAYHPTHERSQSSLPGHPLASHQLPPPASKRPLSEDHLKRGSDPMLAAKLREVGTFHQRAAQSLDMSSLPSLTSGGGSGYSREESSGSPPGSAGFPGHGWGGATTTLYNSSGGRGAGGSGENLNKEMDEVARVINSLELS